MSYKAAKIEFTDIEDPRTGREVELYDGGLVIDARDKSHLGIEVLFCNTVAGIDVEPVICVGKTAAQGGIVSLQSGTPGFGIVAAQIEIAEEDKFRIHSARTIVGIQRVARLFVRGYKSNV